MVQVAEWAQYGWLRHGFSTRGGGVSMVYGPGELNLGWTKEDDDAGVAENRRRLVRAVEGEGHLDLVTVRQVHGAVTVPVGEGDGAAEGRLQTAEGRAVLEGDGLRTRVPGILLGIQTADCVPVLVVDVKRRVVAAIHAGWRGTVAGIVERGVEAMRAQYGCEVGDLVGAVGPSIGVCCYAVGDEVRGKFDAAFGYAEALFREADGEVRLDLWEANRRQLAEAGVERIAVVGECTACAVDASGRRRYFSHRAEKGFTGRMLSVVGVVEE
nr:peptidoglycan editing factor PgeF [Granulicella sp. dw_53]